MLTAHDFVQLQKNRLPDTRAAVAEKVGAHIDATDGEGNEYKIACEIAFYLQKDKEDIVRISLAKGLKDSEKAPTQLIFLLAMDEHDEVAIPILRESPRLQDDDIIQLLPRIKAPMRLCAVAERKFISVTVSSMLAERNVEEVAVRLLSNDSAVIDDEVILQIAHRYARSQDVLGQMMKRMPLPAMAVNHMVKMQQSSGQENRKPSEIKSFTSLEKDKLKSDVLSLMFLGQDPDEKSCQHMIKQLESENKITATLMLLAMCLGQRRFFISYMAQNTYLPVSRVEELANVGEAEFSMLMNKSGISPSLYSLMYWVYMGMMRSLEKKIVPGSQAFVNEMVDELIRAEKQKVNFATTIGKPLAKALRETFR